MPIARAILLIGGLVTLFGCDSAETDKGDCGVDLGGKPVAFPPAQYAQMPDHQGDTIDLKAYQGKVVLLNFWATWCGPCRDEIPDLVKLRRTFKEDEVAIIGISLDIQPEQQIQPLLQSFIDQYRINYPIVLDNQHKIVSQFFTQDRRQMGIPLTYILDHKGRVYQTYVGLPMDKQTRRPNPLKIYSADIQNLLNCI